MNGIPKYVADQVLLERDAARYRWLNKQHNFMIDIEGPEGNPMKRPLRLRCGLPLDEWIDKRIEEDSHAAAEEKDK